MPGVTSAIQNESDLIASEDEENFDQMAQLQQ